VLQLDQITGPNTDEVPRTAIQPRESGSSKERVKIPRAPSTKELGPCRSKWPSQCTQLTRLGDLTRMDKNGLQKNIPIANGNDANGALSASTFSLKALQESSSEPVFLRGARYFLRNRVSGYKELDNQHVEAQVEGSGEDPYTLSIEFSSPQSFVSNCSCPYFEDVCKHAVAVVLTYIQRRDRNLRNTIKQILEERPREPRQTFSEVKAEDFLNTKELTLPEEIPFTLGMLILPKPLALILGMLPTSPSGKVTILKIPEPVVSTLPEGSPLRSLADYLLRVPQTTSGPAGGHRVPLGDEGIVLDFVRYAANLVNVQTGAPIAFSDQRPKVHVELAEQEEGALSLTLMATLGERTLKDPMFVFGSPSWALENNVFYKLSDEAEPPGSLMRMLQSDGKAIIKADQVPGFLTRQYPALKNHPALRVLKEETFPTVVSSAPSVVIALSEQESTTTQGVSQLQLRLGFRYGPMVVPSQSLNLDGTQVHEHYVTEEGQSLWIRRMATEEQQLRQLLSNMQPDRVRADQFFFSDDRALDVLRWLQDYGDNWEVSGYEKLTRYRLAAEPLTLHAHLALNDSGQFNLELYGACGSSKLTWESLVALMEQRRAYAALEDQTSVRIPERSITRLLNHTDLINSQNRTAAGTRTFKGARPLYQLVAVVEALKAEEVQVHLDPALEIFFQQLYSPELIQPPALPPHLKAELRPYQKAGYTWITFLGRYGLGGILADDMGLGKTLQTLTMLMAYHHEHPEAPPSLVIVPTSVVYNWQEEAEKFTPKLRTALYLGTDREKILNGKTKGPKPQVIFTSYGIIRRDYLLLKENPFSYVVLDEAQNIKNPESVGAQAVKALQANHTLALSGTPVENRLVELWSLFDFLMPGHLNTLVRFQEEFEKPISLGLPEAAQKLRQRVQPFILRRLKTDVEKDLPRKTEIISYCDLGTQQKALYQKMLEACRDQIFGEVAQRGIAASQMSVLAALLRLRQVCCDPRLVQGTESAKGKNFTLDDSAKLLEVMEFIETLIAEKHRVLVFSQFVQMLTLVREALNIKGYRYEYLDGQTPPEQRKEKVNRFNGDESIPIFLISLKAGGTGLNLTGADYVIHYDPWWNPAVEAQATDRAYRIGQTRPVFSYKFITRGTIEEKVLKLQRSKTELAEMVLGTDQSFAKTLTQKDLEFLFAP
jgi:SNF2 family DNA or RNA helicase